MGLLEEPAYFLDLSRALQIGHIVPLYALNMSDGKDLPAFVVLAGLKSAADRLEVQLMGSGAPNSNWSRHVAACC